MKTLFPSTKQRPSLHRNHGAHPVLFNPQLGLNLCANPRAPSNRHYSSGLFTQTPIRNKSTHEGLSLADFARQLANT
jgi:hypothetical protein